MNDRTKKLAKIYLWTWLGLGGIPFCIHFFCCPGHIKFVTRIGVAVASLFGPWASQVGRLVDMPNAGGAFHLGLAIGLTLVMLGVIVSSILIAKKWVRTLCISLYMILISGWLAVGLGQLMICMT